MDAAPQDPNEYYPPTSKRMSEAGRVVVTFTVGADGKAAPPFTIDPEQPVVTPRLVQAVNTYLQAVRFATGRDC